jgi:hypothetical protein
MSKALFPQIKPLSNNPTPAELAEFSRAVRAALSVLQLVPQQLAAVEKQVAGSATTTAEGGSSSGTDTVEAPTAAAGLQVTSGFAKNVLAWTPATYQGHAYTEIWRAQVDDLGQAVEVDREIFSMWADENLPSSSLSVDYYYWIRHVNKNGDEGAFNAVHGTIGSTADDPEYLLEIAAEKWQASYDYAAGDLVMPTRPNGYCYEATVDGGSSGTTEPAWPTVIDETVTDGDLVWTCRAAFAFERFFKIAMVDGVPRLTLKDLYLADGIIKRAMMGSLSVDDAHIISMSGNKITARSIAASQYEELRNSLMYNGWDSLDATHPLVIPFLILSETTAIQSIKLSWKVLPYRGYSTAASSGGGSTISTTQVNVPTHFHGATVQSGDVSSYGDRLYYGFIDGKLYLYHPSNSDMQTSITLDSADSDWHTHQIVATRTNNTTNKIPINFFETSKTIRCTSDGAVFTTGTTNGHQHGFSFNPTYAGNQHALYWANGRFYSVGLSSGSVVAQVSGPSPSKHYHGVTTPNHPHAIAFGIHEESNSPSITVSTDDGDGAGYGTPVGYAGDQVNVDLTGDFSGAGWKGIKFSASARCRIAFVLECKLDITA